MLESDEDYVVAFQRQQLIEIRSLFGELDFNLEQLLAQEAETSEGIAVLQSDVSETKTRLKEMGADVYNPAPSLELNEREEIIRDTHYKRIDVIGAEKYQELETKAKGYLEQNGVNLAKDPLLQILTASEIKAIAEDYKQKYGDISWSKADYLVVMAAGVAATLVDIFITGLPPNPRPSKDPEHFVSPVTKKLREHSQKLHLKHFKKLENKSRVPFDGRYSKDVGEQVDGLRSKLHRLMSLGHDPGLMIIGILDTMSGRGTYVDKYGRVKVILKEGYEPVDFIEAFNRVFMHLLSDMFTTMGVPPPFFSLNQLIPGESPFELRAGSGVRVSWTDLARYMYANGYDFRHFISMGLVPASIEMVIRAYWLYGSFNNREQAEKESLKLASMLMLGHLLAAAGNIVKVGIVSSMVGPESAPLAINWAELLALAPVVLTFFAESLKRDIQIRSSLDKEWLSIYQELAV